MCWCFYEVTSRLKPPGEIGQVEKDSKLGKLYYTRDLVAYGIGSTLGAGVYVLAGQTAKNKAGPAVILSFLIAAFGSALSGLCYAEFGGRVPRSGSAYNFSYVCIGEIIAFIIGWDLILEYAIGSAGLARAFGTNLDQAIDHRMSDAFKKVYTIESDYFEEYIDFLAFSLILGLGVALAFGLRQYKLVHNTFVCINLCVITFTIISGLFFVKLSNWFLPAPTDPNIKNPGKGGFFPFGFEGVLEGAGTVFFGFVGFDGIACAGEEVHDPAKSIPLSIMLTLLLCFIVYSAMSIIVTLMVPYYLQDENAPIANVFIQNDFEVGRWIVTFGGFIALITSIFGCLYPLPRMIYAMSKDSMLFKWCGRVDDKFKTPVIGTLIGSLLTGNSIESFWSTEPNGTEVPTYQPEGFDRDRINRSTCLITILTAFLAAFLKLDALTNMMSIGTLLAYTLVCLGILLIRYTVDDPSLDPGTTEINRKEVTLRLFKQLDPIPTSLTQAISTVTTYVFIILTIIFVSTLRYNLAYFFKGENMYMFAPLFILFVLMHVALVIIQYQPKSQLQVRYKVPLVPWIPAYSIIVNIFVMSEMDWLTWIRFSLWCFLGLIMYTSYGYWHSKQRRNRAGEFVNLPTELPK